MRKVYKLVALLTLSFTVFLSNAQDIKRGEFNFKSTKITKSSFDKSSLEIENSSFQIKSTHLNEGFEGTMFPPNEWSMIDADGDGNNWERFGQADQGLGQESDFCARSMSWDGAPLTPDNYLVTPQLNIEGEGNLTFWIAPGTDPDWIGETYSVVVSTTGTDVADFNQVIHTATISNTEWEQIELSMNDFVGQEIYIGFRHHDVTDMWYLRLDNVVCEVCKPILPENELALVDYYIGEFTMVPSFLNYAPNLVGVVSNNGANPQTNVVLNATANGVSQDSEPVENFPTGETMALEINSFGGEFPLGSVDLTMTVSQDEDDVDESNNTLTTGYEISEDVLATDLGVDNISGTANLWMMFEGENNANFEIASLMISPSDMINATAVRFYAMTENDAAFKVNVYDFGDEGINTDPLVSSEETVIEGDFTGFIDIELSEELRLAEGEAYIVAVEHTNGTSANAILSTTASLNNSYNQYFSRGDVYAPFGIAPEDWIASDDGAGITGNVIVRLLVSDPCADVSIDVTGSVDINTISAEVSGVDGDYTVSWSGPGNVSPEDSLTVVADSIGTYTVVVTDTIGCTGTASFEVEGIANLSNLEANNNINVYPNPAKTLINFDVAGADAKNIYVFDATGKAITTLNVTSDVVTYNVEGLETGMYMYHITSQDGTLIGSSRFVVTK